MFEKAEIKETEILWEDLKYLKIPKSFFFLRFRLPSNCHKIYIFFLLTSWFLKNAYLFTCFLFHKTGIYFYFFIYYKRHQTPCRVVKERFINWCALCAIQSKKIFIFFYFFLVWGGGCCWDIPIRSADTVSYYIAHVKRCGLYEHSLPFRNNILATKFHFLYYELFRNHLKSIGPLPKTDCYFCRLHFTSKYRKKIF